MLKNAALLAALLAIMTGCGTPTTPGSSMATGTEQRAEAQAKFVESAYATATTKQLEAISCGAEGDKCTGLGPERAKHVGKKYKVTGKIRCARVYNGKILNFTFYTTIDGWLTVDKRVFLGEAHSNGFRDKIGAAGFNDPEPTVTAYVTVLPAGEFPGFSLDAVKRADGKLVTL